MNLFLFFLGLSFCLLQTQSQSSDLQCNSQGLSLSASVEGTSIAVSSDGVSTTCEDNEVCGFVQYDVDISVTTNSTLWSFIFDLLYGGEYTASATLNYAACADTGICSLLTGGTSNCRTTNIEFESWTPTSCDESNNYGAIVTDYEGSYTYACCSTDDCNDADTYDTSSCDTNTDFTNYVSDLFDCWNDVKKTFMKYLVCDDGTSIYKLVKTCFKSNVYDWSNDTCSYSLTCSDEMQNYLTQFGNCACTAATDNGYSGVLLAEFLQTQWQTYCPNIELTCEDDGTLSAYMYYYYVTRTFYLGVAHNAVTDSIKQAIADAVAAAVNCDSTLVEVTVGTGNDTSTSITVTITTQSEDDQSEVESNLDSSADSQISSATGSSVSGGTTSTSSSATEASTTSPANSLKIGFSVIIAMFLVYLLK